MGESVNLGGIKIGGGLLVAPDGTIVGRIVNMGVSVSFVKPEDVKGEKE